MEGTAKTQLRSFVERIERLEEEKSETAEEIRSVYKEADCNGFDTKALRAVIRLRKLDADERNEQLAILETYMDALGMLADTPLGKAAMRAVKKLGTPVALTEEEKAQGTIAAFEKDGTRMSIT